ncbi:MAG: hypothetical protein U0792_20025 [Gemmataceae bacterium]
MWGSDKTYNHMAVDGRTSTPFKCDEADGLSLRRYPSGMCVAWPNRIKDVGGIRHQFHHMIDIVPTFLEATGLPAPVSVNGIAQRPIEGVSMAYTWDKKMRTHPPAPHAILRDLRQPCSLPRRVGGLHHADLKAPWILATDPPPDVINGYKWELYDITKD